MKILPDGKKSKLLFLWRFLGLLTGLIPALIGKKFIYATIFFVESFVEKHYNEQIIKLKNKNKYWNSFNYLKNLKMMRFLTRKIHLMRFGKLNLPLKIWGNIVEIRF